MLLFTLRGTPTLYYGDELGMTDVPIAPEQVPDPWGGRRGATRRARRCGGRVPTAASQSGEPWLPMGDIAINAGRAARQPRSMLSLTAS